MRPMRWYNIDWGSDETIVLLVVFLTLLITVIALSRVSPRRRRHRRPDKVIESRPGQIID